MNSCFPILVTAEDICEILKTLNLDYIKNEYYRKPSDVKDGKNVFISRSSEEEINKSLSKKGILIIKTYLKKFSRKCFKTINLSPSYIQ